MESCVSFRYLSGPASGVQTKERCQRIYISHSNLHWVIRCFCGKCLGFAEMAVPS